MNLTPSSKASFAAGFGLWCLIWAALFKSDEIAEAAGVQRWFSSERCLNWIRNHKSTSLLSTELVNYTHTGLDPLGVAFALGGTLVNVLVIFLLLPMRKRAKRRGTVISLQQ
jgi:hypothetical protein